MSRILNQFDTPDLYNKNELGWCHAAEWGDLQAVIRIIGRESDEWLPIKHQNGAAQVYHQQYPELHLPHNELAGDPRNMPGAADISDCIFWFSVFWWRKSGTLEPSMRKGIGGFVLLFFVFGQLL